MQTFRTVPVASQCDASLHRFITLTFLFVIRCENVVFRRDAICAFCDFDLLCFTNWARWHMPNYFRPICMQLFGCDILSKEKKKALGGNSNLASRAVHSSTSELGSGDYLWPRHPRRRVICCPRLPSALSIFNIRSALCLSLTSSPFSPLPSPLLYYYFFISPPFSPHLWLSPPGSWGIITQCTGWRFIHYHIKGFLMPHWLAHCYCWGWLNI